MSDKLKNVVVSLVFVLFIVGMFGANLLKNDEEVSVSERRLLTQFPHFSFSELFDGTFFKKFDSYTVDQFIDREGFRKIKVDTLFNGYFMTDYNGIYRYNDFLIEQLYPLNEKSVVNVNKKINEISSKYITDKNRVYYTIIPDKNYFVLDDHLKLDYKNLEGLFLKELKGEYIDIFDELDLSCYYLSDSHWRQDKLLPVVKKISKQMDFKIGSYEQKNVDKFNGVYAGRIPSYDKSDEIILLTNNVLKNSTVYNYALGENTQVYDMDKLKSYDKYDVYLSGASPLLVIDNLVKNTGKELIVFRDSYGSSLIPLLVDGYDKITAIDIRYISSNVLGEYVNFDNQDVLFAYSTLLINNSFTMK